MAEEAVSPGQVGFTAPAPPQASAGYLLWTGFTVAIAFALAIDLVWGSSNTSRGHHVRGAAISSIGWLALGVLFAIFLAVTQGGEIGVLFFTGYLVEKSLSVDNLVVIALIFRSFKIKPAYQGPVLKWGIIGAVVFRTVFIFAGITLMESFSGAVYVFGALLLWSAYKMLTDDDDEGVMVQAHKSGNSWMMRLLTSIIPYHSESKGSTKFVEYIDGRWHATPLLAALVVVELSDLLFAIDSIPCILGLTQDLFLVFSSNMLAILGLRSLYLLLAEALERVKGLKRGLAAVLAFVSVKLLLGKRFPLPQPVALLVIFGILGVTVATSAFRKDPDASNARMLLPLPF